MLLLFSFIAQLCNQSNFVLFRLQLQKCVTFVCFWITMVLNVVLLFHLVRGSIKLCIVLASEVCYFGLFAELNMVLNLVLFCSFSARLCIYSKFVLFCLLSQKCVTSVCLWLQLCITIVISIYGACTSKLTHCRSAVEKVYRRHWVPQVAVRCPHVYLYRGLTLSFTTARHYFFVLNYQY